MASSGYHLRQAQIAASLALAETDRAAVSRLQSLALRHFDKAEKAKAKELTARPPLYRAKPGRSHQRAS